LNLLSKKWANIDDPSELRLLLHQYIGGPGQYDDQSKNPNQWYLPLAGSACRVALTFQDKKIAGIKPGSASDAAEWRRIRRQIDKSLFDVSVKVGRDYSFSSFRVSGSWRGSRSGVQILPPPDAAPSAPYEMAEHPFILEFPVKASDLWPLTNHRRLREHRDLTLLMNVLLAGRVTLQPQRSQHFWAMINPLAGTDPEIRWVQQFYFGPLAEVVADELSPPAAEAIQEIEPDQYYGQIGHDGRGLRVPTDLDDLICRYQQLSGTNRSKFNRAAFWMYQSARVWTLSMSASFAAVVSAVEALTDRQLISGATQRFHDFFETYARGHSLKTRRKRMYALRSDILHGTGLMELDQDLRFSWDPPGWDEHELDKELRSLTRVAIRNWLLKPPDYINCELRAD
jgi:hypothetical protein